MEKQLIEKRLAFAREGAGAGGGAGGFGG